MPKNSDFTDDPGTAGEELGAGRDLDEAARLREGGEDKQSFEGAYAEYFASVCRGYRAQQAEMQRVYNDYLTAMRAAMATQDAAAAVSAQRSFEEEAARAADPARLQESVRESYAEYQKNLGEAFAATDLGQIEPAMLDAIGRSLSHVAHHRIGFGG